MSEREKSGDASAVRRIICISNLIKRNLDCARAQRDDTLTPMHGFIIGYINRNSGRDVFQKDIEKTFSYRRSTASTVLGLMEEKGLIERRPVEYDARLKKLVLTEKSKRFAASCEEDGRALDERIASWISEDERRELLRILDKIKTNLKGE